MKRYRDLIPALLFLLAAILLTAFSSVAPVIESKQEVPVVTDKPIGNIVRGHIYRQEITLARDYINGIEIFFATWIRHNTNDNEILLLNDDYEILFSEKISSRKIKDNQFYPLNFGTNIYAGRGKKIYLCVYSDNGDKNNNVTIWVNSKSKIGGLHKIVAANNDIIGSVKQSGELMEGSMILKTHETDSDGFMLFKTFAINSGWSERLVAVSRILPHYFFMSLFFSLSFFYMYRLLGLKSIYLIVFIVGIFSAFNIPAYSIIDEGAHFDYINTITDNHELPAVFDKIDTAKLFSFGNYLRTDFIPPEINRYEAFQPPLYYILCSSIASLISAVTESLAVRFFSLRIFSVLLLLVAIFFLDKTYRLLSDKDVIRRNDLLFLCVSLLFIFSPVFIKVMIPLSNDHLLVALFTMLIYLLVRYYFSSNLNTRDLLVVSVIAGAIVLTKLTALFVIALPIILFVYKGRGRSAFPFVLIVALMLSPWVVFNVINYGSPTGAEETIKIVKPILNPRDIRWTPAAVLADLPKFFRGVWFFNYSSWNLLDKAVNYFLNMVLALSIIFPVYTIWSSIKNSHKISFADRDKIPFLFLISISLNFMMLVIFTLINQHYSLYGRYMFMNLSCFIFLMYILSQKLRNEKHQKLMFIFCLPVLFMFLFEIVQLA